MVVSLFSLLAEWFRLSFLGDSGGEAAVCPTYQIIQRFIIISTGKHSHLVELFRYHGQLLRWLPGLPPGYFLQEIALSAHYGELPSLL